MLSNRIFEWAQRYPQSLALIESDRSITYFEFARMIEAARRHFAAYDLPRGHFAFVFTRTFTEHFVLAIALRSLGLNTVAAPNIAEAVKLNLRNIACVAISEDLVAPSPKLPAALKDAKLLAVPRAIYARELVREPP